MSYYWVSLRKKVVTKISFSNKKGQTYLDILIIVIILVGGAMGLLFVNMAQSSIVDEMLQTETFDNSTRGGEVLQNFDSNFAASFDNGFLIMFIIFWIFIIVSSLFIDSNPIFLIISIFLIIIMLVVIAVLSNAYEQIMINDNIYTFASAFPKMNYIMEHLVMFVAFIALSGLIATYGKNSVGGGGF